MNQLLLRWRLSHQLRAAYPDGWLEHIRLEFPPDLPSDRRLPPLLNRLAKAFPDPPCIWTGPGGYALVFLLPPAPSPQRWFAWTNEAQGAYLRANPGGVPVWWLELSSIYPVWRAHFVVSMAAPETAGFPIRFLQASPLDPEWRRSTAAAGAFLAELGWRHASPALCERLVPWLRSTQEIIGLPLPPGGSRAVTFGDALFRTAWPGDSRHLTTA